MKEQRIMLKSYRKEIEVLSIEIEVPTRDKQDKHLVCYEDLLLKLFNNKRDDKDILKIENYYDNDYIKVFINLTSYIENNHSSKEDSIEHLKRWFTSGIDIADEDIEIKISKGYVYEVPEWENNIKTYEGTEKDLQIVHNYIEWGD